MNLYYVFTRGGIAPEDVFRPPVDIVGAQIVAVEGAAGGGGSVAIIALFITRFGNPQIEIDGFRRVPGEGDLHIASAHRC